MENTLRERRRDAKEEVDDRRKREFVRARLCKEKMEKRESERRKEFERDRRVCVCVCVCVRNKLK